MRELLILARNLVPLKRFVVQLSGLKITYFFRIHLSLSFYAKTKKNVFLPWRS